MCEILLRSPDFSCSHACCSFWYYFMHENHSHRHNLQADTMTTNLPLKSDEKIILYLNPSCFFHLSEQNLGIIQSVIISGIVCVCFFGLNLLFLLRSSMFCSACSILVCRRIFHRNWTMINKQINWILIWGNVNQCNRWRSSAKEREREKKANGIQVNAVLCMSSAFFICKWKFSHQSEF